MVQQTLEPGAWQPLLDAGKDPFRSRDRQRDQPDAGQEGFDEHPNVKYPLAIFHGHFPDDFGGWRTTPPDQNLPYDTSVRFRIANYNKIVQQEAYDFYKQWTSPGFPRVIAIGIEHANSYYDDSYAVNSANLGPYGDAITYELIPEIEKKFRGIGAGWARFTYGGTVNSERCRDPGSGTILVM